MKTIKVAITGHRPNILFPVDTYSKANFDKLVEFYKTILPYFAQHDMEIEKLYCGMALGVDLAAGMAAVDLKIPVHCAIPFKNQPDAWKGDHMKVVYNYVRTLASSEIVLFTNPIHKGDASRKLDDRNRYMVDNTDMLLAMLDPSSDRGGTLNCVNYAKSQGKRVVNLWTKWESYRDTH